MACDILAFSMGIFGYANPYMDSSNSKHHWSMTRRTMKMSEEPSCKVCLLSKETCICPECPQCGERGKPRCYIGSNSPYEHNVLKLNCHQLVLRAEKLIERLEGELDIERQYLQMLNEQPESFCEDWSEI